MTAERYVFNVFGATMRVERRDGQWLLYRVGADGKSSPVREATIPPQLPAAQLAIYLDDLFHEYATVRHDAVVRLD